MIYELVSLSVVISGKKYSKDTNPKLNDKEINKAALEAALKAGFIKEVEIKEVKEVKTENKPIENTPNFQAKKIKTN